MHATRHKSTRKKTTHTFAPPLVGGDAIAPVAEGADRALGGALASTALRPKERSALLTALLVGREDGVARAGGALRGVARPAVSAVSVAARCRIPSLHAWFANVSLKHQ